ncbi:MAG: peptidyl-prolyl cis-trans isomerase [Candidatus Riflebacteria bacterium]|nr:peptidyl-prolyl cis-trans isomerase [Candidatus Riflebacteria bacterium]
MFFDYLRRKMKAIIWLIVILFAGSIFLLAGGSMCIRQQGPDQAQHPDKDDKDRDKTRAKDKKNKDELDGAAANVIARIRFGDKEAQMTEGELIESINIASKNSPIQGLAPKQMKAFMGTHYLDQLVDMRLEEMEARKQGIDVTEEEKKIDQDLADESHLVRLRQIGISPKQYKEVMLRQTLVKKLVDRVTEGVPIPESRIAAYYDLHKDEFKDEKTKAIRPLTAVRKQIETELRSKLTDDDVKDYYDKHMDRWRLPDRAKVLHLVIDPAAPSHAKDLEVTPAEVAAYYKENSKGFLGDQRVVLRHIYFDPQSDTFKKAVKVTDEAVKKFYESHKSDWERPERTWISRILVKVSPKATTAEKAEAEAKATRILGQLKNGARFQDLAKWHSDDKKSGPQGGDLGPMEPGQMSPPFDKAAFALGIGEVSGLVHDEEGVQLLKATRKEEKKPIPFSEVAEEVKKRFIEEQAKSLCDEEAKARRRELADRPAEFETVAKAVSHAPSKAQGGLLGELYLGENKKNKAVEEVGSFGYMDDQIQRALQNLPANKVSDVVKSSKGGLHILKVDKVLEPEPKPLDDVRAEVTESVKNLKVEVVANRLREEVTRRLKDGTPFVKLIGEMSDGKDKNGVWDGLVISAEEKQTLDPALLADVTVSDTLPAEVSNALKELEPGQISAPVRLEKKYHFFQLVSMLPARHKPLSDEIKKEIRFALNPTVTEPEVAEHFKEHKEEFQPRPQTTAEFVIIREKEVADELTARIKEDAQAFDAHPNKKPFVGEMRNPELRAILAKLKPGELTQEPMKTNMGYVFARLKAQEAKTEVTLDKVKRRVVEKLLAEKKKQVYDQWLAELRKQARIQKSPLTPTL